MHAFRSGRARRAHRTNNRMRNYRSQQLGPGLLESIYQRCMVMELGARALSVETERSVPVIYRGEPIEFPFKVDLVVEESVVVELKA